MSPLHLNITHQVLDTRIKQHNQQKWPKGGQPKFSQSSKKICQTPSPQRRSRDPPSKIALRGSFGFTKRSIFPNFREQGDFCLIHLVHTSGLNRGQINKGLAIFKFLLTFISLFTIFTIYCLTKDLNNPRPIMVCQKFGCSIRLSSKTLEQSLRIVELI